MVTDAGNTRGVCSKGRQAMRRSTVAAFALLALLLLSGSACAFTYAEWQHYGNGVPLVDGRSLALGGAGLASADGARGIAINPALVGKAQGIELAATGLFLNAEESRENKVYDSFDGVITENTYAMNSHLYDRYIGSVAFRPGGEYEWAPAVAVGHRQRLDMSYGYHVQYRDPDNTAEPADKILYDHYADGEGGVNALTVALSQEVVPDVYVGLGVDFLYGDYDAHNSIVYPVDSDETDRDSRAEFDNVSGKQFTLGLLVETLHRLDVAFVYRKGFELEGDYSIRPAGVDTVGSPLEAMGGEFTYEYPDAFAVGFEYHPRNEIMTSVSLDIEYTRWSEFDDKTAWPVASDWGAPSNYSETQGLEVIPTGDADLDDTVEYRLGVEHEFFDDTQARFGFYYCPSYIDDSATLAAFSAGLGLDIVGLRLDVGGQIGVRDYGLGEDRVRETTSLAVATLVYRF
jgi:long-subunit fatty acid transport protein